MTTRKPQKDEMKLTPKARLDQIATRTWAVSTHVEFQDIWWLIERVKRLESALEKVACEEGDADQECCMARKALEGG